VRFKEATEAYEVLSHEEKRRVYDEFGHAGLRGGPIPGFSGVEFGLSDALRAFMRDFGDIFGTNEGESGILDRGSDLRVVLRVSLEDVVTGTKKTLKIQKAQTCDVCGGTGGKGGEAPEVCSLCQGRGRVQRVQRSFLGQFVSVGSCPQCGGRGKRVKNPCPTCRGTGAVSGACEVKVDIPPGVETGDYLNVREEGDAGSQGGPPGDLHVVIEVEEREGFQRHGRDVLVELAIGPARATLGGKVSVPTLDGTAVLEVPEGVQAGTLLRLKGKGLPPRHGGARGSQLVKVSIRVPERLSREQKKMYAELLELETRDETT
jgi:molecular chaperone DnaJ